MARRGISNYEPSGGPQQFNIFWQETLRSSNDGISGIKQAYDLPAKSSFKDVTTTNRELMRKPRDFVLAAPNPELRMALAEPSGDFGRAGRSSWHYNLSRPLGRKVKLHSMASASFDGKHLPHMASLTGTWSTLKYGWTGTATANAQAFNTICPAAAWEAEEDARRSRPSTHTGTSLHAASQLARMTSTPRQSLVPGAATKKGEFEALLNQSGLSSWTEFAPTIRHPRLW
ncbi:PAC1 [Symbiodinium pilosum]|uniref:PAC1 protein n=1 Tax=Symbiodinium pilosum TaxID=2952 RepID=A0A812WUM1_SYMPI|nr:PAC1 [Symbiodinium pilosum]